MRIQIGEAALVSIFCLVTLPAAATEVQGGKPGSAFSVAPNEKDAWLRMAPFNPSSNGLECVDSNKSPYKLDMRYAGENNFTGSRMYPRGLDRQLCMHKECVPKFEAANKEAKTQGCELVVYDGARPCSAQLAMRRFVEERPEKYTNPDDFVGNSPGCKAGATGEDAEKVSMHNRGLAVDLSMDCSGAPDPVDPKAHDEEEEMGGKFDDPETAGDHGKLTEKQKQNRAKLTAIMQKGGFFPLKSKKTGKTIEWWHFNCLENKPTSSETYPIIKN